MGGVLCSFPCDASESVGTLFSTFAILTFLGQGQVCVYVPHAYAGNDWS